MNHEIPSDGPERRDQDSRQAMIDFLQEHLTFAGTNIFLNDNGVIRIETPDINTDSILFTLKDTEEVREMHRIYEEIGELNIHIEIPKKSANLVFFDVEVFTLNSIDDSKLFSFLNQLGNTIADSFNSD